MIEILAEAQNQFEKILAELKKELAGVRTGRPNSSLVENLKVDYYGQAVTLNTLGTISILPPRTIQIHVWDKGAVKDVAHAIEASPLNLAASVDGDIVRVNLPELSAERREELAKHVKHLAEERRIQLRHGRDEVNKKIQKAFDGNEINEDQKFKMKEDVQKAVDKTNQDIEAALEAKIKEISA